MKELIDFAMVMATALGITASIGVMYAGGLRLWAAGSLAEVRGNVNHIAIRVASAACFGACVVVVLFALWLMIPVFH